MPRPSLKTVRSTEILEAYARCVARYGLDGATQERIAAEAGVKRTLLRHYLGNRDAMIDALIDHVVADFDARTDALVAALPATGRLPALLDLLFNPARPTDRTMVLVFEALVAAADRHPKARHDLMAWLDRFVAAIAGEVAAAFPDAPTQAVTDVALAITGLYFNAYSLAPIQPSNDWHHASRRAADRLIAALEAP